MKMVFCIILFLIFSVPSCESQNCLEEILPENFASNWKKDSLGKKHLRIHYESVFSPTYDPKDNLKLAGISKECVIECFGQPERIIQREKNNKVTYIYYINLEWVNNDDLSDYVGTTLEIILKDGVVLSYAIMIT